MQHIEANIPTVLSPGTAGRKRKLSPDQERLFAGFILAKNEQNEIVDLSSALGFLEDHLDVQLSRSTVHNVLHKLGFSSRVMQTSRSGYKLDKEEMIKMAKNWLNARTDDGFFDVHPSELGSIDFAFTLQPPFCPRSFARRNG